MANLVDLVIHTGKQRPGIELLSNIASSSDIATGRHHLVKQALAWNVDWLLWMDADQTFPENGLLRLLAHDLDAVGCNYRRRAPPHLPTATGGGEFIVTTKELAAAGTVDEVDQVGLGFCLVRANAIRKLDPLFPMFQFTPRSDGTQEGEDGFFWNRLRGAGVTVHLDHALSIEIGHITEQVIWNS